MLLKFSLSREWFSLMVKEAFNTDKGLFVFSANKVTIQPSPLSFLVVNHLVYFKYIGRIIALSLLRKIEVEVDFTKSMLKHLLRKTLYISDLEDIDPE